MLHRGLGSSEDEDLLRRRRDSKMENKSSEEELEHRRKVGEFSKHLKREDLRSLDKNGIDSDQRIETRLRSEGTDTQNRRQRVIDEYGLLTSVQEYMPGKIFTEGNLLKPQQWQEAVDVTQRTMQLIRDCKLQNENPTKLIGAGKKLDFYLQEAFQGRGVPMKHYQEAYEELKELNDKVAEALKSNRKSKSVSGFNEMGTSANKPELTMQHSNDSGVDLTFDNEHASEEGPDNLIHTGGDGLTMLHSNDGSVHLPLDGKPPSVEEQLLHKLAYGRLNDKVKELGKMYEKFNTSNSNSDLKGLNELKRKMEVDLKEAKNTSEGRKEQQKTIKLFSKILDELLNQIYRIQEDGNSNSGEKDLEESLPRKMFHNGPDFPMDGKTPDELSSMSSENGPDAISRRLRKADEESENKQQRR